MGILSTISNLASGATGIGTIASVGKGLFDLLGGNDNAKQVSQQKSLMDYQYNLNQGAAEADNARQRQLMQDQYSINKIGQKMAGINSAFGDANSSVGAASSAGVAPPSALPTESSIDAQYQGMITNSASVLSSVSLNSANARAADASAAKSAAEAEQTSIDNQTRSLENLSRIRQLIASAKNEDEKAKYQKMANAIMEKYGMDNAALDNSIKGSQASMNEADAAVRGALNEAELNKRLQELELAKKNGEKVNAEISQVKAAIEELRSRVLVNKTQAGLNVANTEKTDTETTFNKHTMLDREEFVRLQNVPKDTKDLLMRNHYIREYLDCVENGKPVPYRVKWNCDKLLKFPTLYKWAVINHHFLKCRGFMRSLTLT